MIERNWSFSFVFFQFCGVATWMVLHKSQIKFAYRSERKVESFKNPAISWQPAGTYCLTMAISEILSLKSDNFGTFSSQR
jgi:hypothetical protein